MSDRSPAFTRLCDAALEHFAHVGYDGTSLGAIADTVGIRKASIYSHVGGKDELYLLIFDDAIAAETGIADECFLRAADDRLPGEAYLENLVQRFDQSHHLQFMLRAAYFAPVLHRNAVADRFEAFVVRLRELYLRAFANMFDGASHDHDVGIYCEAWLGIFDSLCVEMLYGDGSRVQARKTAMMALMRTALPRTRLNPATNSAGGAS